MYAPNFSLSFTGKNRMISCICGALIMRYSGISSEMLHLVSVNAVTDTLSSL